MLDSQNETENPTLFPWKFKREKFTKITILQINNINY